MTDLSNSLEAITEGGALVPATTPEITVAPDPNMVNKARHVIRQLKAAGLKTPFDFDIEEASVTWSTLVGPFIVSVLDEAVRSWIEDPEQSFPAVGDFTAVCQWVVTERMRRSAEADKTARTQTQCVECGVPDEVDSVLGFIPGFTVRWVRVEDATGDGHHMRPCSRCLPDRYELYQTGHFDKDHVARGGCSDCVEYNKPWLGKSKRKTRGSIG